MRTSRYENGRSPVGTIIGGHRADRRAGQGHVAGCRHHDQGHDGPLEARLGFRYSGRARPGPGTVGGRDRGDNEIGRLARRVESERYGRKAVPLKDVQIGSQDARESRRW